MRALAWMCLGMLCLACSSQDETGPSTLDADASDSSSTETGSGDASDAPDASDASDGSEGGCPGSDSVGFDLDGDGKRETQLALVACAGVSDSTCLRVTRGGGAPSEIKLADRKDVCVGDVMGPRLRDIGSHVGSALHEVSVVHCDQVPVLDVVDVDAGKVVAHVAAPGKQKRAFTDALRDPSGNLHPFLAPSYGDANPVDPTYGAGATWGYLCVYAPERASDTTRCAPGFASSSTYPEAVPAYWFREVGGYLQDMDGDGWEDVNLIFHQQVLALSGKSGAALNRLEYDVAAATEPSSPKWFHSGRNYGTHSAVAGKDGKLRTIEVGGTPIGSFTDYNCNVSRFIAVLESTAGAPSTRRLAWSRYLSFASSSFSKYEATYASDPSVVLTRRGNFVDGCVHRFSDSRTLIDGKEAVLYDIFHGKTVDSCLVVQYQLYLDPAWTDAKQKAWADCQIANLKAKGTWAMEALHEVDGLSITGGLGNYVWGWSDELMPGGEIVYLVETFAKEVAFDLSDAPPGTMQVLSLVKGLWTSRGAFPVPGRPKIRSVDGLGARGVGAYSPYAELTLGDRDCDGLPEVQLEDGTWVGYSKAAGAFVAK